MIDKKQLKQDIKQALKSVQMKHSNRVQSVGISYPTDIRVSRLRDSQMIDKLAEEACQKSKNDGLLRASFTHEQLLMHYKNTLIELTRYLTKNNIEVSFSTGIDYMDTQPVSYFIEGAEAIQQLVQRLNEQGTTKVGIYEIRSYSQYHHTTADFYVKTLIRIHQSSQFPELTGKINRRYNQTPIVDRDPATISEVHKRACCFIKQLEDHGIQVEYTKGCNDDCKISGIFQIPGTSSQIRALVLSQFLNRRVAKISIPDVTIVMNLLDHQFNKFSLFGIYIQILEQIVKQDSCLDRTVQKQLVNKISEQIANQIDSQILNQLLNNTDTILKPRPACKEAYMQPIMHIEANAVKDPDGKIIITKLIIQE